MREATKTHSIEFIDEESQDVSVIVRRCGDLVVLTICIRYDDSFPDHLEVAFRKPDAERVLRALEDALRD